MTNRTYRTFGNAALVLAAVGSLGFAAASHATTIILVEENFGGSGTDPLNGTSADTFDAGITAAGGSATWGAGSDFFADGSVAAAPSGNSGAFLNLGTYIDDAEGTAAGLFILQATLADVGGGFASLGFGGATTPPINDNLFDASTAFATRGEAAHIILRANGENDGFVDNAGAGQNNPLAIDGNAGANNVAHTLTLTIDVRDHNGVDNFGSVLLESSVTGVIGNNDVNSDGEFDFIIDTNFGSIFLSDNGSSTTTYSALTLTQVVPEPGSLALLSLGGLLITRRRRG